MCCALPMTATASATASMDEQLTSGASGRIIPVFKDLRRAATVLSFSLRRFFLFLYSVLRCFLLILLPHHRRRLFFFFSSSSRSQSQSLSEDSSSSSSSSSRRRFVFRRFEEDTLRRRALAEGLGMLSEASVADSTSLFVGLRRNALFCRSWFPVPPTPSHTHIKGILVIIHGLNEHSGRYAHFARQLTSNKFGVYAMDWIGHGGSDGLHGYVPSLDHVVADTGAFLEKVKSENPGVPCFLFGHSTGGAVVLKAASDPQIKEMLEGIVLTSPALRVKPAHPIVRAVAPLFSLVIPTFQFKGANKRGIPVSRDPAALLAKYSDPLVYTGPIRVRTGHEILRISSYLMRNFRSVTIPFFVLHGTADKVTDPLASKDLYTEASSTIKDIRLYDGFLHDLLFEPEREAIAQDIIEWMDKRLSDAGQRA